MARDLTEMMSTSGLLSMYNGDGILIYEQTIGMVTQSRIVNRPDSVNSPLINGFRKPTEWYTLDRHISGGLEGDMTWHRYGLKYNLVGQSHTLIGYRQLDGIYPSVNSLNRVEVQTLLKVKDQKVNLSVAFAETHKTIELFADRFGKLYRSYKAVKRGNLKLAAKILGVAAPKKLSKNVSKDWLELQYGWFPLVQDLHGAYELACRKYSNFGYVINAKSTFREPYLKVAKYDTGYGDSLSMTLVDSGTLFTTCRLSYRVESDALRFATAAGIDNPSTVVWEGTPWSFLLDWAIPIGNLLEAYSATVGLTFLGGDYTRGGRVARYAECVPVSQGSGFLSGNESSFAFERKLYQSSPFPVPYYKNPWSVGHALNALALMRTLL